MNKLLQLVNTEAGRHLLGLNREFPVIKTTPNSVHQWTGESFVAKFWLDDFVYRKIGIALDKIEVAETEFNYESFLHFTDLHRKPYKYPSVYLATSTFNNNTGDGYCLKADVVWATARNAATADSVTATTSIVRAHTSYQIRRSFFPIDTSSLPNTAIVSASSLTVRRSDAVNPFNNGDSDSVVLVPQAQASNTILATGDYDSVTFTSKAAVTFASTSNGADLVFNNSDQSLISLTGHTQLALISKRDLDNAQPTAENSIGFLARTDGSNPPELSVTYTVPSNFFAIL